MLYLCTGVTGGSPLVLWCMDGGMGSMLSGITWGVCWGEVLSTWTGLIYMSPGVSNLVGGARAASGVSSGLTTLGDVASDIRKLLGNHHFL